VSLSPSSAFGLCFQPRPASGLVELFWLGLGCTATLYTISQSLSFEICFSRCASVQLRSLCRRRSRDVGTSSRCEMAPWFVSSTATSHLRSRPPGRGFVSNSEPVELFQHIFSTYDYIYVSTVLINLTPPRRCSRGLQGDHCGSRVQQPCQTFAPGLLAEVSFLPQS
jgi:hypothetical protein